MVRADGKLFVGQVFSEFVLAIAIDTQSIVRRIMVPGGGEGAIAASRDGRYIYTSRAIGRTAYLLLPAPRTSTKSLITQQADGAACVFFRIRQSRCSTSVSSEAENLNGTSYVGGNCFLATYDLTELRSINNLYLAEVENGRSDDSTPICLTCDEDGCLFVGMFQSKRGICRIDEHGREILANFLSRQPAPTGTSLGLIRSRRRFIGTNFFRLTEITANSLCSTSARDASKVQPS